MFMRGVRNRMTSVFISVGFLRSLRCPSAHPAIERRRVKPKCAMAELARERQPTCVPIEPTRSNAKTPCSLFHTQEAHSFRYPRPVRGRFQCDGGGARHHDCECLC